MAKNLTHYSRLFFSLCRAWCKSETFHQIKAANKTWQKVPLLLQAFLSAEPGVRVRLFARSKQQTRPGEESHSYSSLCEGKRRPRTAPQPWEGGCSFLCWCSLSQSQCNLSRHLCVISGIQPNLLTLCRAKAEFTGGKKQKASCDTLTNAMTLHRNTYQRGN